MKNSFVTAACGWLLLFFLDAGVISAEPTIHADRPNPIAFPPAEARFVRVVILGSLSGQPCIDELEIYGPDAKQNLALARDGARATASSCLSGYAIHRIAHLNDGRYGNSFSWIAAGAQREWAQIELPHSATVAKVVFSRDREGRYADRVPVNLEIQLSTDGQHWETVQKVDGHAAPAAATGGAVPFEARVPQPPPPPRGAGAGPTAAKPATRESADRAAEMLRYATLGEEHAWLKTYGRADLSPRLVPYNPRVVDYPRHVGDDAIPLPPLDSRPTLDGTLDDPCWNEASRGVVRVVQPDDFEQGPLVEYAVSAGCRGDDLFLGICTNRLLSSHVAVISRADGARVGVLAHTDDGPVLNTYSQGKQPESVRLDGRFDGSLTCCEVRLPLAMFPDWRSQGLRIGLGMGGKHTAAVGRPVLLRPSSLSVAEVGPCVDGTFHVRLRAAPGGRAVRVRGDVPGLAEGATLSAGQSKTVAVAAQGPIGPEHELTLDVQEMADGAAEASATRRYTLHLFRYDPLQRSLALMEAMLDRFRGQGLDVRRSDEELAGLRARHDTLSSAPPDLAAERRALFDARAAKRRLFFRVPELASLQRILFVKRHAFEPSHNYSVLLDSLWRPGGGVYRLDIPHHEGSLDPDRAELTELFRTETGIVRNPMADFDLGTIYFAHRESPQQYYRLVRMDADGGNRQQLTDGPFHDYWPCPLPDGGLAFISTRCRARYLCWRPQAAVLFRMDADGRNIRPLSFANLTEWAPSVMDDGRIIWTRSEYLDKGANFGHTLWTIRPDGAKPELVFGNTVIQPAGYANGRQVPGTAEICCTMISHFGDLNGPLALLDTSRGRFNPDAITNITPEVPRPGGWPIEECFRDPVPVARDYFLCSHAPQRRFALYVIDRFGNREMLHLDPTYSSVCPTLYRKVPTPPKLRGAELATVAKPETGTADDEGQFVLADVYRGLEPTVARGTVKYLRVAQELRADLIRLADGTYQQDHTPYFHWYATPVDRVSGPYGWPTYVAKATWGIVPVEEDGSANFYAPAGKVLYFQALDADFNELQRMRSVVQLQPGESRSCIGCHEDRRSAPPVRQATALRREPSRIQPPPWGAGPFSYEQIVQPVFNARCTGCHDEKDSRQIDLTARLDADHIPASYRTLISQGWVHYADCGYESGGCEKLPPLTLGTLKSKLWEVLDAGHYDVKLTVDERRRLKCWIDLNCPLWPDYQFRDHRTNVGIAAGR
ncbi:MAG: discoidin domain-containing protein [Pirellulales bacterium]|nr:discoidin domain-containing protein [Pirellulales bacterium]